MLMRKLSKPEFVLTTNKVYALAVLLLNVVIVASFWVELGQNYTPVNDGWVCALRFDNPNIILDQYCTQTGRVLNTIPYWLLSKMPGEGFYTISLMLAVINIFIGTGLYLVLARLMPKQIFFCAVSSLLITYYPLDGTMFWIGAIGVSLGYLFSIFSIHYFFRAIDNSSNTELLIACFLLICSGNSYSGYLLMLGLMICVAMYSRRKTWETWWPKATFFVFLYIVILLQFATNLKHGSGRESNVADLNFDGVISGFKFAFQQLYYKNYIGLNAYKNHIGNTLFFLDTIIIAVTLAWISLIAARNEDSKYLSNYSGLLFRFAAISPIVLLVGYAPYAVSLVRFGTERQFLFARPGIVLLYASCIFLLVHFAVRKVKIANLTIVVLSTLVLMSFISNKSNIAFWEYKHASEIERIFLGDLAEVAPTIDGKPYILVYLDDNDLIEDWNKNVTMLITRPSYLVRYLYRQYDLEMTTVTPYLLWKLNATYKNSKLLIKDLSIPSNELLIFHYSLRKGFERLDEIHLPSGDVVKIPTATAYHIEHKDPTERQQWFINERNRLIQALSISR